LADAMIFLSGDSLDRWKWRLLKLRRLADSNFLALYLDVQLLRKGSASLAGFVENHLASGIKWREALYRKLKEA
jgi:hypothetical protein